MKINRSLKGTVIMFKKPEPGIAARDIDTLIGPATRFKGDIESSASVRVDGYVEGNINARGDVLVGNSGEVKGNIDAENVLISGVVEGNVNASGTLKLFSTARLCGDITVSAFVSDEGGIFQGHCSMIDAKVVELESNPDRQAVKKTGAKKEFKKSALLTQNSEEKIHDTTG